METPKVLHWDRRQKGKNFLRKHLPATENLLRNGAFETLQADGCQIAGSSLEFRLKRSVKK